MILFESLLKWGLFLFFIISLIVLYIKKADKQERYIGWKMAGYFLLGTFTFRFNEWVLPVGIIIFLVYFSPRLFENKQAKKWAAYFGIASFLSGVVIDFCIESYYERDLTIRASSGNVYKMSFYEDYEELKKALHAEGELVMNSWDFLSYHKNGEVEQFNYDVYFSRDGKRMGANIRLQKGVYKVTPYLLLEEETAYGTDSITSPGVYFKSLDTYGLKKMAPEGDFFHVSFLNNSFVDVNFTDAMMYDLQKDGIVKRSKNENQNQENPMKVPYHISITAMKNTGAGTYEGIHQAYYTISPDFYE
jgi:hypothetical protein